MDWSSGAIMAAYIAAMAGLALMLGPEEKARRRVDCARRRKTASRRD